MFDYVEKLIGEFFSSLGYELLDAPKYVRG